MQPEMSNRVADIYAEIETVRQAVADGYGRADTPFVWYVRHSGALWDVAAILGSLHDSPNPLRPDDREDLLACLRGAWVRVAAMAVCALEALE